jgi:hypothetical protein
MKMLVKKSNQSRCFFKAMAIAILTGASFYMDSAYAVSANLETMITNFSQALPNLMRVVTALAYVMGMFFIIKGVIGLKNFGESRTARDDMHGLKGPLALLFVGAALLYLPTSVQTGISTFWQSASPLAYEPATKDSWNELIKNIFLIIQLIGTIAFIRGLVILSHMGEQQQQGSFGRAMAHIVGGIMCINMYQFIQVISSTLGITI